MTEFSIIFFRGYGIPAFLVRLGCWSPLTEKWKNVPGHVAVRIGDWVYQAVSTGVERFAYSQVQKYHDVIDEIDIPRRSEDEIAAALTYAQSCIGEKYSWHDILITVWGRCLPFVFERFPNALKPSKKGTICSLYALLILTTAGCKVRCTSPATTPDELLDRIDDYIYALTEEIQPDPLDTHPFIEDHK